MQLDATGPAIRLCFRSKFGNRLFLSLHDSLGAVVGVDLKDNGIDIGTLQDGTYLKRLAYHE